MKTFAVIYLLTLLLYSCQSEKEMLTGEILGTVKIVDQYLDQLPDQSGVHVALMKDGSLVQETLTDAGGNFSFEEVAYGKYTIPLTYEKNYVNVLSSNNDRTMHVVYHVGGYNPTTVEYALYEVPAWEITVDSVVQWGHQFRVYLKINGDTLPPLPSKSSINPFRGYAGNSPDVSAAHYTARMCGHLEVPTTNSPDFMITGAVYGIIYLTFDLYELSDETKYIRLYPIAGGQYVYSTWDNPDALGPPSNVVSFDFDP